MVVGHCAVASCWKIQKNPFFQKTLKNLNKSTKTPKNQKKKKLVGKLWTRSFHPYQTFNQKIGFKSPEKTNLCSVFLWKKKHIFFPENMKHKDNHKLL